MAITVTVEVSVEISGEDFSTGNPMRIWGQLQNSPAQIWQYELQGPTGGTGTADNYILIPGYTPTIPPVAAGNTATFLWIDPQPVYGAPASGATFILKGSTGDVGVALSSYNPSLIPLSTANGGSYVPNFSNGGSAWSPTIQLEIDIASSQTIQTQMGFF